MEESVWIIRVNQFTDGPSGHVNNSFLDQYGNVVVTYGANLSPNMGVQDETAETARRIVAAGSAYSYSDIRVTQAQYERALSFAQAADAGYNAYRIFCNNCVDFSNALLQMAGQGEWSIKNHLKDGTLTDIYANVAQFLCDNPYYALMDSMTEYYNFHVPEYVSNYYASLFGGYPAFWTGDYLSMYDFLRSELGVSSWDDYVSALQEDYAWFGSPIAIDLNGDGLKTTDFDQSSVHFDITGDGVVERTAWLDAEDGFVVFDRNENGVIDDVGEMFGGAHRGEGYAELARLDDHVDGVVNVYDMYFDKLMLWQDKNQNGLSESNELQMLADRGVSELRLNYTVTNTYRDHGNLIGEVSSALVSGAEMEMGDIYFVYESLQSSAGLSGSGGYDSAAGLVSAMSVFDDSLTGGSAVVELNHSPMFENVQAIA